MALPRITLVCQNTSIYPLQRNKLNNNNNNNLPVIDINNDKNNYKQKKSPSERPRTENLAEHDARDKAEYRKKLDKNYSDVGGDVIDSYRQKPRL